MPNLYLNSLTENEKLLYNDNQKIGTNTILIKSNQLGFVFNKNSFLLDYIKNYSLKNEELFAKYEEDEMVFDEEIDEMNLQEFNDFIIKVFKKDYKIYEVFNFDKYVDTIYTNLINEYNALNSGVINFYSGDEYQEEIDITFDTEIPTKRDIYNFITKNYEVLNIKIERLFSDGNSEIEYIINIRNK